MSWWSTIASRLLALDAKLARQTSEAYARDTGRVEPHALPPYGLVTGETAGRLLGDQRAVVLHHWATWCEGCVDELPLLDDLHGRLGRQADVVGINWDRFTPPEPDPAATAARVAAFAAARGTPWPSWVFDGDPDALSTALGLAGQQIPQTRVIDRDGGLLRAYDRALTAADVDAIVSMLGA